MQNFGHDVHQQFQAKDSLSSSPLEYFEEEFEEDHWGCFVGIHSVVILNIRITIEIKHIRFYLFI